jgi:hypothetical protein
MKVKYANGLKLERVKSDEVDLYSFPYIAFENNNKEMEYYKVVLGE